MRVTSSIARALAVVTLATACDAGMPGPARPDGSVDGGMAEHDARSAVDAAAPPRRGAPDAGKIDASPQRGAPDASPATTPHDGGTGQVADARGGHADASDDAGAEGALLLPGWSVRKRVPLEDGGDLLLEEGLSSFTEFAFGATRIERRARNGGVQASFDAPDGTFVSDVCLHPSGEITAVAVDTSGAVFLHRLDATLAPLATEPLHDPDVAGDLPGMDAGVTDVRVNGLARDAARVATVDEDVVLVVYTSMYSVIAYRMHFGPGGWSAPLRTLLEPPRPLTPFLPTGGTFDTFAAMVVWFRAPVDTDEAGNAYVAIWANAQKIRAHVAAFHDGLAPLPGAFASDADVLVTRMNRDGTRAWSRVVGTVNEDEPYAIRARGGRIAVVGRSRRAPGFDNTFWDAFVSVSSYEGEPVGTRALAFNASSIFLAADALASGAWVLGGSDGWSQNPDGLSVLTFGSKLLVELPAAGAAPVRIELTDGPRHNEVRSIATVKQRVRFAGHEDGPIMHTGDGDRSAIHATGFTATVSTSAGPDASPP